MQHRISTKTLHRTTSHRKAMLKNLSTSLVEHEKVVTTVAKAKYLRPHFEKLITKAKEGETFNNVKYMKKELLTDASIRKMLSDLRMRYASINGGYTRIVKLANRAGDNAPMARIELTQKPIAPKAENIKKVDKITKSEDTTKKVTTKKVAEKPVKAVKAKTQKAKK